MKRALAFVGVLTALNMPAAFAEGAPPAAQWTPDVSYGPYAIETMQMCEPKEASSGPRVASLLIHGGAWVSEDKRSPWFTSLCENLAARGIVTFNINYRLIHIATNENAWPAQLEDVQLAMRWVRAHAKDYNIDPRRVCAFGTSAGGNLAALLGIEQSIVQPLKGEDPKNETALYTDQTPQASCVVDISGPTDLTTMPDNSGRVLAAMASPLVGDNDVKQALVQISPIGLVNAHTAPTLVIYGTLDRGVPSETQSLPFYQALKEKGVPAKLLEYTGHHALGLTAPDEVARALDAAAAFENGPR
jgi:acetyl esterase/lipase